MADFTVTLANGWTLRARVERVTTHIPNVSPRAQRQTSMKLRFAVWDDETKAGVNIDADDAQVLLGMHALGNTQRTGTAAEFEVPNGAENTEHAVDAG